MARYSVFAVLKEASVPEVLRGVVQYIPQQEMLQYFTVETMQHESPGEIISEELSRRARALVQKYPNNIIEIMSVSHTLIG